MIWLVIVGAPLALALWFAIFTRWTRGIDFLLLYIPFAGAIVLWLAPNLAPLLFKDFLFVIPLYFAFVLVNPQGLRQAPIPPLLTILMVTLAVMVLLQIFNPNLPNFMVGAIGAKVWLFYMPMLFIGAAALRGIDDLIRILRLMVAVAVVPFVVGLGQYVLADVIGYQEAIQLFYGEAAEGATQGFGQFDIGATLYRIPSTFSFVSQYSGYCLSMIAVSYALARIDTSLGWRSFARVVFALAIVAGLLSGARGNFIFIPLLLALLYVIDARVSGVLGAIILLPPFLLAILWFSGYDPLAVFGVTETLVGTYGKDLVLPSILDSVQKYPMGLGTGVNTGPARYALSLAEQSRGTNYESVYAKAVTELGIPGLLILVALFGALLYHGFRAHVAVRERRLKSCSAALLAFVALMVLHSLKGWQIDVDPVNVYFWLFAGMLFKLPVLSAAIAPRIARPRVADRIRRGAGSIRLSARARPRA